MLSTLTLPKGVPLQSCCRSTGSTSQQTAGRSPAWGILKDCGFIINSLSPQVKDTFYIFASIFYFLSYIWVKYKQKYWHFSFSFRSQSEVMRVKWIHTESRAAVPTSAFWAAATSPGPAAVVRATAWASMECPVKVSIRSAAESNCVLWRC